MFPYLSLLPELLSASFLFSSMSHLPCPRIMSSSLPFFFYSYPPFPYILFISLSDSMRFLLVLLLSPLSPPLTSSWSSFAISFHNTFAPTLPLNHTNLNYVHSALPTSFLSTFFLCSISCILPMSPNLFLPLSLCPYSSCLYCADSLCTSKKPQMCANMIPTPHSDCFIFVSGLLVVMLDLISTLFLWTTLTPISNNHCSSIWSIHTLFRNTNGILRCVFA